MSLATSTPNPAPAPRLIDINDVERQTGFKKSYIHAGVKKGSFPKPVRISRRCTRWFESDVSTWIEKLRSTAGAS